MAIMAPLISRIASSDARIGDSPFSILKWTASTTTIALSTTIPMAKTRAKSVIKFKENPNICINKNVPTSETGTAMAGIKVERQSCKKIKTTNITSNSASINVLITS